MSSNNDNSPQVQGREFRAGAGVPPSTVAHWRELWAEAVRDATWTERHTLRDSNRREVLPQIRELVIKFLDGTIALTEFKATFDLKTRNEWDLFGLKGLSGAMFLNQLAKNLPDQEGTTSALKAVLAAPSSDADAQAKLNDFIGYLEGQVTSGAATGAGFAPSRSAFFVSACWHVQKPSSWPIVFKSARDTLQTEGLLGTKLKGADAYLAFVDVFRELSEALGVSFWELEHLCVKLDSSRVPPPEIIDKPEPPEEDLRTERVWLVAPGPGAARFDEFFRDGIVAIDWGYLGDLSRYPDLESIRRAIQEHRGGGVSPIHDSLACYQFAHEMQVGDIVLAKKGIREIVGYGIVSSAYRYEPDRGAYPQVRSVDWKSRGHWPRERPMVTKTLTEVGAYKSFVEEILSAIGVGGGAEGAGSGESVEVVPPRTSYLMENALEEIFAPLGDIEEACDLLRYKKNLVVQGPPGVGKTFFAKRLAYLLLGEKDPERIELVQFHQSYSYEDFVQGYRPTEGGRFARADGPFLRFCDKAMQDSTLPYVLIIDEINRGNLSKVFGELLMLVEADKRSMSWATTLTYSREGDAPFFIPSNLHIIGTMNTADRALAMVDYALRRRFAFVDLRPAFGQPAFVRKLLSLPVESSLRGRIVKRLDRLNERIRADSSLGEGFCVGHSYFCGPEGITADDAWFKRIVRTEIGPLLREYWFDNADRAKDEIAQLLDDD